MRRRAARAWPRRARKRKALEMMRPLEGIRVLDFSTLLPGPMATLVLAEAGAEVLKIERPGRGDEMRSYVPKFGDDSVNFALLNRGKRSLALDLKAAGCGRAAAALDRERRHRGRAVPARRDGPPRPGLRGLVCDQRAIIYCAITGYGQTGPRADVAAHDLNYRCRSRHAGAGGRRRWRAGAAAGADRRHRRRRLSGDDQHPAGAAPARPHRQGLQARYRDGGQPVHLPVLGASATARSKGNGRRRAANWSPAARRATRSIAPATASSSPRRRWKTSSGPISSRRSVRRRNCSTTAGSRTR